MKLGIAFIIFAIAFVGFGGIPWVSGFMAGALVCGLCVKGYISFINRG